MRLKDQVAIVTGAGSGGIGRAVCERFAEEGAWVAAFDIAEDGARTTADLIAAQGGRAIGLAVDVRDEAAVKGAVEEVAQAFGGVDIMVHCAGVMHNVATEEESVEGWDRVLDTNLKGAFLVSKHVLPHMRRRGRGAIVHIGSVTGIMGYTHLAAYCASKGGLHALTRAMAIEYAPLGIRVNAVAPGTVDTPILAGFLAETQDPQKARASFERIHPLGRIATPRDIANAALFLASDEAAFVTGHVLVADGGFTIHGVQPRE